MPWPVWLTWFEHPLDRNITGSIPSWSKYWLVQEGSRLMLLSHINVSLFLCLCLSDFLSLSICLSVSVSPSLSLPSPPSKSNEKKCPWVRIRKNLRYMKLIEKETKLRKRLNIVQFFFTQVKLLFR